MSHYVFQSQRSPVDPQKLHMLEALFGKPFPASYIALMTYSNGGSWSLNTEPYVFNLFELDIVEANLRGTDFSEVYPNCLPIGGDGMDTYFGLYFDPSSPPGGAVEPQVVTIDAMEASEEEAVSKVAVCLGDFLELLCDELEE